MAECPSSVSAFSFLFEKTNKPALIICETVHNDSDDSIPLEPEQNDSKYSGLLAYSQELVYRGKLLCFTSFSVNFIFLPV